MDTPPVSLTYGDRDHDAWLETLRDLQLLDPDLALWPVTILQRWPFTGHPTRGIWPKGWLGVDNTPTMWICRVGGEPGQWSEMVLGDVDVSALRAEVEELQRRIDALEPRFNQHDEHPPR